MGDTGFLLKDYDNNTKTRKGALDLTYGDKEYKVIAIFEGKFRIKSDEGGQLTVFRSRIKKKNE